MAKKKSQEELGGETPDSPRTKVLQRVYGSKWAKHKVRFPWRRVRVKDRGQGSTPKESVPQDGYAQFVPTPEPVGEHPVTHERIPNAKDLSGAARIVRSEYVTRDPEEIHYLDRRSCTKLGDKVPRVDPPQNPTRVKGPDGSLYVLRTEWVEIDEHGSVFAVK